GLQGKHFLREQTQVFCVAVFQRALACKESISCVSRRRSSVLQLFRGAMACKGGISCVSRR
ncbi:MAG: hypothetical protein MJY53_02975, partial [Bacteroidales bacterium]|nr:hypothetical protein [Bacteroidales bacterium]